jgi:hypothetical protein
MSRPTATGFLLRLYPSWWRARYGEELQALIVESSGGPRVRWRIRLDVALAAGRERLHAAGLSRDNRPEERALGGALLVLVAWTLFVVAGAVVQRFSEHWPATTPADSRGLPSGAFTGLVIAAGAGSVLVLAGLVVVTPSLVRFLRSGGWPTIRRPVVVAALLTGVALAGTVGLVVWAQGLTAPQRNGHDLPYGIAFVAWGVLCAACLAAWTVAAVATARRLRLPTGTLRLEAWIAAGVTLAMAAMTIATAIWWAALEHSAPWVLAGEPAGSFVFISPPALVGATTLMLVATLLGAFGAGRALGVSARR